MNRIISYTYIARTWRMTRLLARRDISWHSYKLSLRPTQVTVATVQGCQVFCDRDDERLFFGLDASEPVITDADRQREAGIDSSLEP
ncbi:Uncharacterised protein [Bordetella ansorpii]|uniref:Uncharacterized protein n=1 Tax=Bordetella ansorpii TaxID=288768 RepID=A0A157ST96_9BORD|nr:hypothetical protein [Bordetella ansorpii]SAI73146.1 Uncharacterised protein [Bordetella ansorpii]